MRYLLILLFSCLLSGWQAAVATETDKIAQELGAAAEQRGDLVAAVAHWGEAIEDLKSAHSALNLSSAPALIALLIRRGEALRGLGFYSKAEPDLKSALTLSSQSNNVALQSVAVGALGLLYDVAASVQLPGSRGWPDAEPFLRRSHLLAEKSGKQALISVSLARIGEHQLRAQAHGRAQQSFERSLVEAQKANNTEWQLSARLNLAEIATALGQPANALTHLQRATEHIDDKQSIQQQASSWLAISYRADELGSRAQTLNNRALNTALALTSSLDDLRLSAAIHGQAGAWYEYRGQPRLAQRYTKQALLLAPTEHDLAMQWEWRLGRMLQQDSDTADAIAAYRRAVHHVQNMPVTYSGARSSLRETLVPIHLELADLLMQQSDRETDPVQAQQLLFEAQDIVERMKSSELQDYFRDVCVINQSQSVGDQLAVGTAALYPVILPDRLALLLRIQDQSYHVSVPVTSEQLTQSIQLLAEQLRYKEAGFQESALRLHDWLITPIAELLGQHDIDTIVFIPDGALRIVPLTALWDGDQFLIEKYALSTAPGLTLLNSESVTGGGRRTLFAGLSRPGPVVNELPLSMFEGFLPQQHQSIVRGAEGRRMVNARTLPFGEGSSTEQLQDALALPGVKAEIESLAQRKSATVLLDERFVLNGFENEVLANPYRVVHVASHGYFGGTAKDSWIMTYDHLMNMDGLNNLFKPKEFADEPIELLVLSACQTAEGDDRAPLGLSGVALTSGARSVLGSLWPVADVATTTLMHTFYDSMDDRNNTKVQALRQAQLRMLQNDRYQHPFYWASFVLIGSWL